jgi:hypothetical protein
MPAYLNGNSVFGIAVQSRHQPNLNAAQLNAFFGLTGNQSLFGGGRGRGFLISGLLSSDSPGDCVAAESLLLSYADGLARAFTDPLGITWSNVCFYGEYQRTGNPQYLIVPGQGWVMPYKCVLIGLT